MAPAPEPPIRLLVVDDHLMVREGLRSMLSGEEIEIVGEASTGGEAVRIAADLSPARFAPRRSRRSPPIPALLSA